MEAAKAMKKGNKDKKDRTAQGFKENLKRLLLPTSAAEIEEYKKSMRAAYVALFASVCTNTPLNPRPGMKRSSNKSTQHRHYVRTRAKSCCRT